MSDRSLKIGLIVSIILNVFLIGGVAGGLAFWRLHPQSIGAAGPAPGAGQRRALRFAADGLQPAQQRAFRQALRQARLEVTPQLQAGQAARRTLLGLIGASPFDRPAVEAALADARGADGTVRTRTETAIVDYAAGLSPADRTTFLAGLARSPTLRQPPARQKQAASATDSAAPIR